MIIAHKGRNTNNEVTCVMELLQLQYFRELARNGHLSRTAEALHIAQPSLSQTIKRLESEVGIPLFDRVCNRIVLNDSGRIFLKYTDQIFAALDHAALELEEIQGREEKTVTLYICSASMFLPEIVRLIQQADPEIRLRIFCKSPADRSGFPALCVTSSPVRPAQSSSSSLLLRERIKAALPAEHPLAAKRELTWKDLEQEPFISLDGESDLTQALHHFFRMKGIEPNTTICADTPSVMRDLLRLNLGIAFIPEYTWHGFAPDTVVLRTVRDLPMERYLLLSWEKQVYQTHAWKTCRDIITEYFLHLQRT